MTGAAESGVGVARPAPARRSIARLAAVQALYEMDMAGAAADTVLRRFLEADWEAASAPDEMVATTAAHMDRDHFQRIVRGVAEDIGEIDGMIEAALSEAWTVARLEVVLKAVLRAGTFELKAGNGVPPRVVISEYMDVAHAFFSGGEPGLVNAVLDRLGRVLKPEEMEAPNGDPAGR